MLLFSDEDMCKAINSLLSDKTALIKKRQLMRAYCGDYREKMAQQAKSRENSKPFLTFFHIKIRLE